MNLGVIIWRIIYDAVFRYKLLWDRFYHQAQLLKINLNFQTCDSIHRLYNIFGINSSRLVSHDWFLTTRVVDFRPLEM